MSSLSPINPKPFLRDLIGKKIVVTLKFNNTQYRGILVSTDNYFNLQLSDAEEFISSQSKGKVGDIFLRCNNVLWIGEDRSNTAASESEKSENALESQPVEDKEPLAHTAPNQEPV
ncbi:LAFA_0C00584g1_1 [Lachancea sp. 'fantastica']|nr:LAFA_0C00584g1_1 [Lachancea sp. 'fantastica']